MHLCIDQGNSCAKIALFENGTMQKNAVFEQLTTHDLEQLFAENSIQYSIISSVVTLADDVVTTLQALSKKCVLLDHTTPLPIKNLYQTPQTLGKDRLAAAVGANYLKPNSNLLIIDAGSAITYDFVNAQNEYLGGCIAPGLQMRLKALHQNTDKLPLVELTEESLPLFGKNTHEAILAGVTNGVCFEIDGFIQQTAAKNPNLSTFLTGGNLYYFYNRLKNATFAEKFLVLIGLNRILEYNA